MSRVTNTRQCAGPCRRTLPETAEFYSFEARSGTFFSRCKACRRAAGKASYRRTFGDDGLRGAVQETKQKVGKAFIRINPNGAGETALRRQLRPFLQRFRALPYEARALSVSWLITELLRPEKEGRS